MKNTSSQNGAEGEQGRVGDLTYLLEDVWNVWCPHDPPLEALGTRAHADMSADVIG